MRNIQENLSAPSLQEINSMLLFDDKFDFLPIDYVEDSNKRKRIMAELNSLPVKYRITLLAYYYLSMNEDEISEVMETTPIKVKSILLKAEAIFKERVEKIVGRKLPYILTREGFEPVMTQFYNADANEEITAEQVDRLQIYALNIIYQQRRSNAQYDINFR